MTRTLVHLVFVLLVLTSGCATETSSYSVDIAGNDERVGDSYRFSGEVSLGGHYSGVSVKGVWIKILDKRNRTLEKVFIGTLNVSNPTKQFNVTVDKLPKYVLVFVPDTVAPKRDIKKSEVSGLERSKNGHYYAYSNYNPYIFMDTTQG